jgi:hypothetical protein
MSYVMDFETQVWHNQQGRTSLEPLHLSLHVEDRGCKHTVLGHVLPFAAIDGWHRTRSQGKTWSLSLMVELFALP